mmetsp:Transcript_5674/g.6123  ORF Transcript_5674/g.6123 Transcript_5674/m.6123 type:complete len:292 (+) Transcript_5674:80-955(+)
MKVVGHILTTATVVLSLLLSRTEGKIFRPRSLVEEWSVSDSAIAAASDDSGESAATEKGRAIEQGPVVEVYPAGATAPPRPAAPAKVASSLARSQSNDNERYSNEKTVDGRDETKTANAKRGLKKKKSSKSVKANPNPNEEAIRLEAIAYFKEKGIDPMENPGPKPDQVVSQGEFYTSFIETYSLAFYSYVKVTIEDLPKVYEYRVHSFGIGLGLVGAIGTCYLDVDFKKIIDETKAKGGSFNVGYGSYGVGVIIAAFSETPSTFNCVYANVGVGGGSFIAPARRGTWKVS